jgi:hypothetical protein
MIGFILAMLYVAYSVVVNSMTAESAIASTMGFLWYWHVVFAAVLGVIVAGMFILGLCGAVFGGQHDGTRAMGVLTMFVGVPLMLFLLSLGSAVFLGGVHCVGSSIARDAATGDVLPFSAWNTQMLVIGCGLYGVGLLWQLMSKSTSSSK